MVRLWRSVLADDVRYQDDHPRDHRNHCDDSQENDDYVDRLDRQDDPDRLARVSYHLVEEYANILLPFGSSLSQSQENDEWDIEYPTQVQTRDRDDRQYESVISHRGVLLTSRARLTAVGLRTAIGDLLYFVIG